MKFLRRIIRSDFVHPKALSGKWKVVEGENHTPEEILRVRPEFSKSANFRISPLGSGSSQLFHYAASLNLPVTSW